MIGDYNGSDVGLALNYSEAQGWVRVGPYNTQEGVRLTGSNISFLKSATNPVGTLALPNLALTAARTWTLPDATGTFALTATTTLQAVTTAGNTTNSGIVMTVGEGTDLQLRNVAGTITNNITETFVDLKDNTVTNTKEFQFLTGSAIPNQIRSVGTAATSTGLATLLTFPNATQANTIALPDASGTVALKAPISTVATLPGTPAAGDLAFVTDANATTFASIVAGGGSNQVPVYYDGTNWRIG